MQILAFRLGYLPTVAEEALQIFQVHADSPLLAGPHIVKCNGKAYTAEEPALSLTASCRMSFLLASTLPGLNTSASPYPGTPINADGLHAQWHIHVAICCVRPLDLPGGLASGLHWALRRHSSLPGAPGILSCTSLTCQATCSDNCCCHSPGKSQ